MSKRKRQESKEEDIDPLEDPDIELFRGVSCVPNLPNIQATWHDYASYRILHQQLNQHMPNLLKLLTRKSSDEQVYQSDFGMDISQLMALRARSRIRGGGGRNTYIGVSNVGERYRGQFCVDSTTAQLCAYTKGHNFNTGIGSSAQEAAELLIKWLYRIDWFKSRFDVDLIKNYDFTYPSEIFVGRHGQRFPGLVGLLKKWRNFLSQKIYSDLLVEVKDDILASFVIFKFILDGKIMPNKRREEMALNNENRELQSTRRKAKKVEKGLLKLPQYAKGDEISVDTVARNVPIFLSYPNKIIQLYPHQSLPLMYQYCVSESYNHLNSKQTQQLIRTFASKRRRLSISNKTNKRKK